MSALPAAAPPQILPAYHTSEFLKTAQASAGDAALASEQDNKTAEIDVSPWHAHKVTSQSHDL